MFCGNAVLNHIVKPENPYMFVLDYLDIDVFIADASRRRPGIGTEMICLIRD